MARRTRTTIIAGVAAGVAAAWLTTVVLKARRVRVEEVSVSSPYLPLSFDGTRIVFVSDIHAGPFVSPDRMARIVDMVNGLTPDILILGGDNVGGRRRGDEIFYPEAKRFRANLAKIAVLGNHDAWEGVANARRGLANAGITLLENENLSVAKNSERIIIAGLEDLWTAGPDIKKAAKGVKRNDFAILVTHNPDELARSLPPSGHLWNLALAGHTHGGQVTFFGKGLTRPTHFGQRYRTGWRTEHGVPILVSNGVGMVTVPFRLFATPEVHVITLMKGDAGER
ncbi:MAG: metallophosphoesterase [Actinomycetota bacterium]